MDSITKALAKELNLDLICVDHVVQLLDEGNTIPFIARYRKELHGGMDDTTLRTLEDRLGYLRNLAARRGEIKKAIGAQGKLTPWPNWRTYTAPTGPSAAPGPPWPKSGG